MKHSTIGCAFVVSLFLVTQGNAANVTNNEITDQKVVIIEGDAQEQLEFAPGQTIEGLCASSCVIRLQNGDEYELEPEDVVSIESGSLFVEPQAQGSAKPDLDLPLRQ